tara:strand:- start:190 stop:648 length:459 start_codon:yes stop_codon:yes gene_type:complete
MNSDMNWIESPQTKKLMVMQEFDNKNGVSKIDLSTGYYTNEYPLNYKKHPNFDIEKYEEGMPGVVKGNRYDDGESYWYPSTIRTSKEMVFPHGFGEDMIWCYAKVKPLTEEEKKKYSADVNFESFLDMANAENFDSYLEAAKKCNGFSLGDL